MATSWEKFFTCDISHGEMVLPLAVVEKNSKFYEAGSLLGWFEQNSSISPEGGAVFPPYYVFNHALACCICSGDSI